jgi:hypothetical protein
VAEGARSPGGELTWNAESCDRGYRAGGDLKEAGEGPSALESGSEFVLCMPIRWSSLRLCNGNDVPMEGTIGWQLQRDFWTSGRRKRTATGFRRYPALHMANSDAAVSLLSNRSSKHALPQRRAASLFRGVALA